MITGKRKNFRVGGSTAFTIPHGMTTGENTTLAANRIMLVDPKGEISPEELEEFLETHIEPIFWKWRERVKNGDK